jgi:hypothetical protein
MGTGAIYKKISRQAVLKKVAKMLEMDRKIGNEINLTNAFRQMDLVTMQRYLPSSARIQYKSASIHTDDK